MNINFCLPKNHCCTFITQFADLWLIWNWAHDLNFPSILQWTSVIRSAVGFLDTAFPCCDQMYITKLCKSIDHCYSNCCTLHFFFALVISALQRVTMANKIWLQFSFASFNHVCFAKTPRITDTKLIMNLVRNWYQNVNLLEMHSKVNPSKW